jgi:hypothetical protein
VELPTKSTVITPLRKHAFPSGELAPSTRPLGCSESWVTYLARCVRQRRCREAPPIATGCGHSLFVDAAGQLLWSSMVSTRSSPTPLAAMAMVKVRSAVAEPYHNLAVGWNGRLYSWGHNTEGQLGHGAVRSEPLPPAPVEGLNGVRGIAGAGNHSLAVTQSGCRAPMGRLWAARSKPFVSSADHPRRARGSARALRGCWSKPSLRHRRGL